MFFIYGLALTLSLFLMVPAEAAEETAGHGAAVGHGPTNPNSIE
jgi:hypothetical protein